MKRQDDHQEEHRDADAPQESDEARLSIPLAGSYRCSCPEHPRGNQEVCCTCQVELRYGGGTRGLL